MVLLHVHDCQLIGFVGDMLMAKSVIFVVKVIL